LTHGKRERIAIIIHGIDGNSFVLGDYNDFLLCKVNYRDITGKERKGQHSDETRDPHSGINGQIFPNAPEDVPDHEAEFLIIMNVGWEICS
jgi:hypothetical protein